MKPIKESTSIFLLFVLSFSCTAEELIKPGVKLPGIYSVWKGTEPDDMSSITMEEISKCMSNDAKMKQSYEGFQLETKLINEDIAKAESMVSENQSSRLSLEQEATLLQAEIKQLETIDDQLSKRKQNISVQTSKKVDAETAKKINQQIDQFNKDVTQFNTDSLKLKEKSQLLNLKQKNFNENLDVLRSKLNQINAKTNEFNERKKTFDNSFLSFNEKCTGKHRIEK